MQNNSGNKALAKLLVIGVGAVFLYSNFGGLGIVALGIVLLFIS